MKSWNGRPLSLEAGHVPPAIYSPEEIPVEDEYPAWKFP
jgi:hypothetical protein